MKMGGVKKRASSTR